MCTVVEWSVLGKYFNALTCVHVEVYCAMVAYEKDRPDPNLVCIKIYDNIVLSLYR